MVKCHDAVAIVATVETVATVWEGYLFLEIENQELKSEKLIK